MMNQELHQQHQRRQQHRRAVAPLSLTDSSLNRTTRKALLTVQRPPCLRRSSCEDAATSLSSSSSCSSSTGYFSSASTISPVVFRTNRKGTSNTAKTHSETMAWNNNSSYNSRPRSLLSTYSKPTSIDIVSRNESSSTSTMHTSRSCKWIISDSYSSPFRARGRSETAVAAAAVPETPKILENHVELIAAKGYVLPFTDSTGSYCTDWDQSLFVMTQFLQGEQQRDRPLSLKINKEQCQQRDMYQSESNCCVVAERKLESTMTTELSPTTTSTAEISTFMSDELGTPNNMHHGNYVGHWNYNGCTLEKDTTSKCATVPPPPGFSLADCHPRHNNIIPCAAVGTELRHDIHQPQKKQQEQQQQSWIHDGTSLDAATVNTPLLRPSRIPLEIAVPWLHDDSSSQEPIKNDKDTTTITTKKDDRNEAQIIEYSAQSHDVCDSFVQIRFHPDNMSENTS